MKERVQSVMSLIYSGNCWFLAALASLTQFEDHFKKVVQFEDCLSFDKSKGYTGVFRFRFWVFGQWTDVVIDDRLPTCNGRLIFVQSSQGNEFWSSLIEKAYAKLALSFFLVENACLCGWRWEGVRQTNRSDKDWLDCMHCVESVAFTDDGVQFEIKINFQQSRIFMSAEDSKIDNRTADWSVTVHWCVTEIQ